MYVWLQCLCEVSENIDDIKGESVKVEVGTNGSRKSERGKRKEKSSSRSYRSRMRGSTS